MIEHARAWGDMVPHLSTLIALAAEARTVVEFGVRGGVSTWALLDGLHPDGSLTSIDIDADCLERVPARVSGDPRWTFVVADTTAPDIQAELPPHADLFVIDTSHEYHATIRELEIARRLNAAVVVLHDYNLADVEDAVQGFLRRQPHYTLTVEPSEWGLAVLRR